MLFFDGSGPAGKGRGGRFGRSNYELSGKQSGMGGAGLGVGGNCICTKCGAVIPHQRQVPCTSVQCPKCGGKMIRQQ